MGPNESRVIVCESCGHTNVVEQTFSEDLRTVIRCSDCCHPQSICQRDLLKPEDQFKPELEETNDDALRYPA
jgi:hypothetical protein